jgi:predicted RNA-binding Zn-ribbon protein involved in translation (DUF1610 family)
MTSILDQMESISRHASCPECGGTILTGCPGTEQEHYYCDRCDWTQDRSEVDTWYTWRTDAVRSGMWADSADDVLASLVAQNEWPEIDSAREAREIADGAWLTIFDDGVPAIRRGQMP